MEITRSLVARLVAAQFPQWSDLPVVAVEPGGWDNRTFRLGERMLVRLPSAAAYAAQVDKEQQWLPILAPLLPLPIPTPVVAGEPGEGYPWRWSVHWWVAGEPAPHGVGEQEKFGRALAAFLRTLQHIDPTGGPPPGDHNFWRGGPVETYDRETRDAIRSVGDEIDTEAATAVWEDALTAEGSGSNVWVHGDVAADNLLVAGGDLNAVIDFGCCAVGDPACDLTIAWTLLSGKARDTFRDHIDLDDATWARARGWALWKALITLDAQKHTDPAKVASARATLEEVLADHRRVAGPVAR